MVEEGKEISEFLGELRLLVVSNNGVWAGESPKMGRCNSPIRRASVISLHPSARVFLPTGACDRFCFQTGNVCGFYGLTHRAAARPSIVRSLGYLLEALGRFRRSPRRLLDHLLGRAVACALPLAPCRSCFTYILMLYDPREAIKRMQLAEKLAHAASVVLTARIL